MKDSLNTLKELASSVRNATKEGENSAERIGRLFEGILEYIKTPESIENYFELKQDSNGLDYIYTKYNIASAGALSMYASDKINVPSIYDGLPIDNDTIYWLEVDGSKVLKAKGGGGEAGSVQWDNISGKPSWIEDTKPSYSWSDITGEKPFYTKEEIASKYVTIDTEQEITALKHFTAGLSVGESKKKIYEENGVVYIDADVAVTGAMTFYASAGRSVSTIMDGVIVDEETITKGSDNVLRIKNAGAGSSFDKSAMWTALAGSTTEQINKSHLTTALTGYATESWVSGKNYVIKATTLAGYGITDGINAVSVTGTGNAVTAASISGHTLTLTKGATFNNYTHPTATATTITAANGKVLSAITVNNQGHVTSVSGKTLAAADIPTLEISKISGLQDSLDAKLESSAYTAADVLAKLKTVDGSNSGLDADLLDGTHKTALFTALASSSATNISITVGGTTKSIADLFANSAAKLETARTIWGQSFDGTKPVTGALTSVTDITGTGTFTGANLKATDSVYVNGIRLHKTADGVITLEGNLAVTGGVTMYAIDPVSVSTVMDGVVVDGTTIKKENGKLVAVGGGEAGSVAWGNISGKPSVFATNIANITDLHSSWDSVLAAQKPAWLTAVSIATISDLHANWDALLKAAPSAYVTRWPTISEVTGKQNLIVKLNGGTTEGTNQFTYNATGAKTINITPAGIGAAASSHNHSWSNITSGKPTTLAGYGITDGVNSVSVTGGGNAITSASISGHKLTLTKGNTFVLLKERNINTTNKGLWDIDKTNGGANCWNNPVNTALQLQNNNNALAIIIDGNENGRMANIQVGHENINYAANVGALYLNRLGGDVYIGTTLAATINSNVASATKLQNTRYLWGVAFDGTKNIEGTLTIYSDNTFDVGTDACNFNNVYARVVRNTKARDMVISQDASAGLVLRTSATNRIYITSNGYVGINKNNPSFALDVSGYIRAGLAHLGAIETNTYGTGEWTDTNMLANATIKSVAYGAVSKNSAHCHIGWKDVISGVGYSTYYAIGSARENSNWGSLYFAVGNNDAGTSAGCKLYLRGYGQAELIGNLLVTGGTTFYESDQRAKNIIGLVYLSLMQISEAPTIRFRWNGWHTKDDGRNHIGGIAQYIQGILPEAITNSEKSLSMDYATVAYTFAVHTARHLLTYESRTDKKIKKLENRVKYLEKQLKKLGYEEVRTLDDSGI
jgi:hypothetical protein